MIRCSKAYKESSEQPLVNHRNLPCFCSPQKESLEMKHFHFSPESEGQVTGSAKWESRGAEEANQVDSSCFFCRRRNSRAWHFHCRWHSTSRQRSQVTSQAIIACIGFMLPCYAKLFNFDSPRKDSRGNNWWSTMMTWKGTHKRQALLILHWV